VRRVHPRLKAAAKPVVSAVNTPLARARLKRSLAGAPRPLKIEIGGLVPRPGWLITNVHPLTKHYMDATIRWPMEDGAASFVYADNVIEHITLAQARAMLAEAYRCLRPGGVLRLVTPDLRAHVELYLSGEPALQSPAGQHYRNSGLVVEHPVDLVRVPIASFGHHIGYLYDFETLDSELRRAGFDEVIRCELGRSSHPELDGIDQSREGGSQVAVEATRR
jgi:SAM-dependent methyltransferase